MDQSQEILLGHAIVKYGYHGYRHIARSISNKKFYTIHSLYHLADWTVLRPIPRSRLESQLQLQEHAVISLLAKQSNGQVTVTSPVTNDINSRQITKSKEVKKVNL